MEMKVSVPFATQRHSKLTRMMSVEEGANLVASFAASGSGTSGCQSTPSLNLLCWSRRPSDSLDDEGLFQM